MRIFTRLTLAFALVVGCSAVHAEDKPIYRVAWTIYAGSMPLGYAQETGILSKWGERYGIDIEAVQMNDYIEAQNQYTAGQFDGVIAITLDALTIPAAGGVDSSAAVLLSASNGSDGLVLKGADKTVADLKGMSVNLVELSGSHYLLARALAENGMSERDLTVVNTSDADIIAAFQSPDSRAVVTWKPQLSEILANSADTTLLYDSSDIPNEITDILVVRTETLEETPELGYALAGAWYEVIAMLSPEHPDHDAAVAYMAEALATDAQGFAEQTATINFFTPSQAVALIKDPQFAETTQNITQFAWDNGLLGEGASGPDYVGIQFGEERVLGNDGNIKLRFPTTYSAEFAK
ncbi:MAG: putative urea ABC transporter substrate-binding protein [Pseudomonas sp.]|uniref:putative urea ABC transporter substrate-binding protein n=1 Tax=Halopseudomonas laoshanensis TaxID=2268758 RepID=UPI001B4201C0|nr:putative urea ABC transporter substrate-binding protein [Pseudomonas sp.]WOD10600.1 putative urea ABC transporter substrate-binding protein [Pseudomonas sp. NyZ704]